MKLSKAILALTVVLALGACSSKFKKYNGPEVTRVVVMKTDRKMYLMNNDKVLKTHDIDLGFTPAGHKVIEGDGKTPEGRYRIDRRNPNSSFHLSIGINYPNERDVEVARAAGESPGGDIFIHGAAPVNPLKKRGTDWTAGCISVSNKEIEWVYAMVKDDTPVDIYP